MHWCSYPFEESIKWASDPFCKMMLGARRSPCTTPHPWVRQSSSTGSSWWLSGYLCMELLNRKSQARNSTPLIHIEAWDVSYHMIHVCHYQHFEMLWAKETIDFWYASSLQVWQNLVDISFSLQHLFSILLRRNFDGVLFITCCVNEYLSCCSMSNTLGKQYFTIYLIGWDKECIGCQQIFNSLLVGRCL